MHSSVVVCCCCFNSFKCWSPLGLPKTSKMLPSPSLKIHIAFEARPRLSLEIFRAPLPRINLEVNNNPLFEVSLKIQGISRWKLFRGSLKKNNFLTLFYNLFLAICAIFSRFFEDSSKNLKFLDLTLASYFEAYSRGTLESY